MRQTFLKCFLYSLCVPIILALVAPFLLYYFRESPRVRGLNPLITPKETWGITHEEVPSQQDRLMIITGANTGLGFSSTKILAQKGAKVVMGCRSMTKCTKAAEKIRALNNNAQLYPMEIDLSSLSSVQAFAKTFMERFTADKSQYLGGLMLNAGVMACPYSLSEDGIEMQFAVNHVGHHYLTKLLLPSLQESDEKGYQTHITSISSSASFNAYEPQGVKLSLQEINDKSSYNRMKAYGQSKLSNILFAQELQKRVMEKGMKTIVTAVHPGAVETDLPRHFANFLPKRYHDYFFQSFRWFTKNGWVWESDVAALSQVFAITTPSSQRNASYWKGAFIVPLARKSQPPSHATNLALQSRLWDFTESLISTQYPN